MYQHLRDRGSDPPTGREGCTEVVEAVQVPTEDDRFIGRARTRECVRAQVRPGLVEPNDAAAERRRVARNRERAKGEIASAGHIQIHHDRIRNLPSAYHLGVNYSRTSNRFVTLTNEVVSIWRRDS